MATLTPVRIVSIDHKEQRAIIVKKSDEAEGKGWAFGAPLWAIAGNKRSDGFTDWKFDAA